MLWLQLEETRIDLVKHGKYQINKIKTHINTLK